MERTSNNTNIMKYSITAIYVLFPVLLFITFLRFLYTYT